MGCICEKAKAIEPQIDSTQVQELSKRIKTTPELLRLLIKIQSVIRGILTRKKIKIVRITTCTHSQPNISLSKFTTISTNKITYDEIKALFEKYPKLNDGVETVLRQCVEYENKAIYYGEWMKDDNIRHGRGIQLWIDGSRYEGYWKNNKANIKGKLNHADGDVYEGEWYEDKAQGYGVYTHTDGAEYKGQWKDDHQHGEGIESWPDGAMYKGDYVEGKKCGNGKFQWGDGSSYEGQFFNNNINGKGCYIWSDKRKYTGYWKDNKMHGTGLFEWPDGRKYEGEYVEDKKEGFGCFEWVDGRKYRGNWKNGKQHGEGEFYNSNVKKWKKGIWNEGKRVKWVGDKENNNEENTNKQESNEPQRVV